jgi:hypothetical protein
MVSGSESSSALTRNSKFKIQNSKVQKHAPENLRQEYWFQETSQAREARAKRSRSMTKTALMRLTRGSKFSATYDFHIGYWEFGAAICALSPPNCSFTTRTTLRPPPGLPGPIRSIRRSRRQRGQNGSWQQLHGKTTEQGPLESGWREGKSEGGTGGRGLDTLRTRFRSRLSLNAEPRSVIPGTPVLSILPAPKKNSDCPASNSRVEGPVMSSLVWPFFSRALDFWLYGLAKALWRFRLTPSIDSPKTRLATERSRAQQDPINFMRAGCL